MKRINIFYIDGCFNSLALILISISFNQFGSFWFPFNSGFLKTILFIMHTIQQFHINWSFPTDTIPKGCDLKPSFCRYTITRYFTISKSNNPKQSCTMNGKVCDFFFFFVIQRDCLRTLGKWVYLETQITEKNTLIR